jgi:hypothetical protein
VYALNLLQAAGTTKSNRQTKIKPNAQVPAPLEDGRLRSSGAPRMNLVTRSSRLSRVQCYAVFDALLAFPG